MAAENRRLQAENKQLRRVNEVLRAASAHFAAEIGPDPNVFETDWNRGAAGRLPAPPCQDFANAQMASGWA